MAIYRRSIHKLRMLLSTAGGGLPIIGDFLLLESGDDLTLESGESILLE